MIWCIYKQRNSDTASISLNKCIYKNAVLYETSPWPSCVEYLLDLTDASAVTDIAVGVGGGIGAGDVLAAKVLEEAGVGAGEGARGAKGVSLAAAAEGAAAGAAAVGDGEELAADGAVDGGLDVLEDVALGQDHAAGVDLEGVARVGVEVVVDGVHEGVAGRLGRAARRVVDVVALERHQVRRAGHVDAPVVVAVASGTPRGRAVNLRVGDGDAVRGALAQDDVLAADEGGLDVVDPDHVGAVQGDGVATPNVLGVDVGDVDVLDDDVLGSAREAQALALDDTGSALADQTLVGLDGDAERAGLVVADRDLGGGLLVVVAPAVLVDGELIPENKTC